MQAFILLNIETYKLQIVYNPILVTIHPKAFWTSESNKTTTQIELIELNLIHNKITHINSGTFDPLINLENLFLFSNKLSNIDNKFIINLNKLTSFDISYNELTRLPNKWLPPSLTYLSIRENDIQKISSNTFDGAINLEKILLSYDNIYDKLTKYMFKCTIEYDTFSYLHYLRVVEVYVSQQINVIRYRCSCLFIWYLNTAIVNKVCDNSYNKYKSLREYLKEECKHYIPG